MAYLKCFVCLCVFGFGTFLFSLFLLTEESRLFRSVPDMVMDLLSFDTDIDIFNDDSIDNDENISTVAFQTRIGEYYPRFPIHIETQNLTTGTNHSKLILLGNGFFSHSTWGIVSPGDTSADTMRRLACPFLANYCHITSNISLFSRADAVVYHGRDAIKQRFAQRRRRRRQRFVFALWESPMHTPDLYSYKQFFNWTMTYRWDSDIVASYFWSDSYIHRSSDYYRRLVQENTTQRFNLQFKPTDHRPSDEVLAKKKLGTVAALISNCIGNSRRLKIMRILKRYVEVKIYGKCGEPCPANVDCREFIGQNYYFFLSFENSICTDYTTEKFFSTLKHPIIPVVYGRTNYSRLIPTSGFIDLYQFATVSSLAQQLIQIRNDKEKYRSYFAWKQDYVWGATDMFTPFCDLCLRLHLDSKPSIIDDIHAWWHEGACKRPILVNT